MTVVEPDDDALQWPPTEVVKIALNLVLENLKIY